MMTHKLGAAAPGKGGPRALLDAVIDHLALVFTQDDTGTWAPRNRLARVLHVKAKAFNPRTSTLGDVIKAAHRAPAWQDAAKATPQDDVAGPLEYARAGALALGRIPPAAALEMRCRAQNEHVSASPELLRAVTDERGGPREVTSVRDIMVANRLAAAAKRVA